MKSYLDIVERVLTTGQKKETRAGNTISVPNVFWEHDSSGGIFPILTSRKMPIRSIAVEVEGFIKGITTKKWYQERGCKFWNYWSNPLAAKKEGVSQIECDDLGPLGYSYQMRRFGEVYDEDDGGLLRGTDQLKELVNMLKTNPNDRRMVVTLWNPPHLSRMALPPCMVAWAVNVTNGELNISWFQRSGDLIRGIPNDIISMAFMQKLLAVEAGLNCGKISALFVDCHIYENQIPAAKELIRRGPTSSTANLTIKTSDSNDPNYKYSIFTWTHKDFELYDYYPNFIKLDLGEIAI